MTKNADCSYRSEPRKNRVRARGFSQYTQARMEDPMHRPLTTEELNMMNARRDRVHAQQNAMNDRMETLSNRLFSESRDANITELQARTMQDAARAMSQLVILTHHKKDGLMLRALDGTSRFATWRERLAIWLLKGKTRIEA